MERETEKVSRPPPVVDRAGIWNDRRSDVSVLSATSTVRSCGPVAGKGDDREEQRGRNTCMPSQEHMCTLIGVALNLCVPYE